MKRTLTSDEVINEIAEILRQGDGEFITEIANRVLVPEVSYLGDSMFEQETIGEARILDPNNDEFQCAICKEIYDVEDSIKSDGKKGDMICVGCSNTKEIEKLKEEIDHLESVLPHITDRNELSGTHEIIYRLEARIKDLENNDELPVDSDGCLIHNDGDAETDME